MGHIYTNLKILYYREKLLSLLKDNTEIFPPLHVRIKPTNLCNHNCYYCAYRVDHLQLGKDMKRKNSIPREKILEIIDDFEEIGVKAVTFSGGGDPFCYPYLTETVKKLSETKIKFAALTNGSLLEGEAAEIFSNHGTWLRVSMDGWDEKSYSFYRKTPKGEFKKILCNMENFKKKGGKCYLGAVLVIDKNNYPHIYNMVKRLKSIGVDSVKIAPCIVSNEIRENNKYHNPFFKEAQKQINKATKELKEDNFEVYDSYHKMSGKFKKNYTWCPYIQILTVIGADLNIYTCQDKAYNLSSGLIGSIKNKRFREFWFADKNKFFKLNPSIQCQHHCISNKKNELILEYLDADPLHLPFV